MSDSERNYLRIKANALSGSTDHNKRQILKWIEDSEIAEYSFFKIDQVTELTSLHR